VAGGEVGEADAVLDLYPGELLPDDLYEPWTGQHREAVKVLRLDLMRLAHRWEQLLRQEPADEEAHLALAGRAADRGDRRGALRQLERLELAVRRELGTAPGPAAAALRQRLSTFESPVPAQRSPGHAGTVLVGRRQLGERLRARIDEAASGRGGPLLLSGPAGVGKTALAELAVAHARSRGFRVARGAASAVEGPWPYASVLEAFGDLSRSHPALLDGLDDAYREEIDRALTGRATGWTGESSHQRLFVAAAELVRLAATGRGLLMVIDDVHEADEASLRLLHYLSRFASHEPILVLLAHRPPEAGPTRRILGSLVARAPDAEVVVPPLSRPATLRLLDQVGGAPDDVRDQVAELAAGIPFTALTLARAARSGTPVDVVPPLPDTVLRTFRRVALLGTGFTTDELLAVSELQEEECYRHLEVALTAMLVEPTPTGHRFRHHLVRDALVAQLPASEAVAARVAVAERLAGMGAPPARVAHQLLAAGMPRRAVPFVIEAVEAAGALGAYRDALALVDQVVEHAGHDELPRLLTRRGDLLTAMGDPAAVSAYTTVLPRLSGIEERLVRSRLARVAAFAGDLDTARAAIAGLDLEGDAADGPLLLARGNLAFFAGDTDGAWKVAAQARELLDLSQDSWHLVDLISLQGLIAHQRGEWFDRFRTELRRTQGKERLATALFDAHLCVAEYMLYGPVPYEEVIEEAEELRRGARRYGALRGVAFATSLIGEAELLRGDLDRAEVELSEAVELHRDIDAPAGEAHGLQRLAEVRIARGDKAEAVRLLRRALRNARWSVMALHLVQRIYGTLIAAAPNSAAALALVDEAGTTIGDDEHCLFCDVMLEVPAAIACADGGDLDGSRRHLQAARRSAARWEGTAWMAGVAEAEAHLAVAEGRARDAQRLASSAVELYGSADQPRDAARCRDWLDAVDLSPVS
jgi:tetratricopeptide (TPR) repeat protein